MDTKQPILVDVRSAAEYASGHVEHAIHLPLDRLVQDASALLPDKSAPLVLYCVSGARSAVALQCLQQMGYTQVSNGLSAGAVALQTGRGIRRI